MDVARIPPRNLRVPRAEFAAVWAAAQRRAREQGERGVTDWYAGGVAITCRWMAGAVVRPVAGSRYLATSPISGRIEAYEELIEEEFLAAEVLDLRWPELLTRRPGWCESVRATLRWAWRHDGPPLSVEPAAE